MGKVVLSREHAVILIFVVSLLIIGAVPVFSQDQQGKIGVASATFRQGIGDSPLFGPVISSIVAFELNEAGFHSESFPVETAVESAFDQAAAGGMDLLLVNRYTTRGNEINLTFSCYFVPEKRLLVEVSGKGDFNLTLDGVIRQMLQKIIKDVEGQLDELPSLAVVEEEQEPEQETAAAPVEADPVEAEPKVISGEIVQPEFEPEVPVQPEAADARFRHFELSLGFSPFFPVGDAADYFTIGLEPWLYTGYRFKIGSSSLTLGAYGGVNIFTAEGVLISSENLLIATGGDLRLLTSEEDVLRVGFRLAGGAAFLMVNPNDQGYQTAVVPFGSGGLSIDIGLGAVGLALQFNYTAYFEQSVIIMGFSPGGQISLRL